jgi:hypothetical protein
VLTPSTSYVKKDTLFTKDSNDDDFDNKRKGDNISLNLTESDDENEDNDSGTFTQNGINVIEWTSPTMWKPLQTHSIMAITANNAMQPRRTVERVVGILLLWTQWY